RPADARADRAAAEAWASLRAGRRRVLRGAPLPDVWKALGQESRRARGGSAGGCRRAQARPARLRAVEGGQARRALVAIPVGRGPEGRRLYFVGMHYRHPLEFADERVSESAKALGRLQALVEEAERIGGKGTPKPGPDGGVFDEVAAHRERFEAAMDDDFNTPQALGVLFDLARFLQGVRTQLEQGRVGAGPFLMGVGGLVTLGRVLGLLEGGARA